MNKLFSKIKAVTSFSVIALLSMISCVNQEYDLSNGFDMDMHLLRNTSIPLGNISTIRIDNLIGDEGSMPEIFSVDSKGNMSLSLFNDVLSESFNVPAVSFDGEGGFAAKTSSVDFVIDLDYTNIPGSYLSDFLISQTGSDILYYTEDGVTQNSDEASLYTTIGMQVDKELPEEILSVRSIDMDATLHFNFTASNGAILHVEEGLTIDFPDYMCLVPKYDVNNYKIVDNHIVVFTEDTEISDVSPFVLDLKLTGLQELEQMLRVDKNSLGKTARFITRKDNIEVSGKMYIRASDYGSRYIPTKPRVDFDVVLSDLDMTSADVILDVDFGIDDMEMEITGLPEMFTSEDTVLDLYNPILRFRLNNGSPFELNLNAEISAYAGRHQTDIHVGDNCIYGNTETEPIMILAEEEVEYYFSRQGKHDSRNGEDIKLEDIGDIISELPDRIEIHEISVVAPEKFVKIYADRQYDIEIEYEFLSPLSFGKDLNLTLDYDIDLGLGGNVKGIESLKVSMDMVNTIPLNFDIKGVALDSEGNEIEDASVNLDLSLPAGTLDNPTEAPLELLLQTSDSEFNVAKLRLLFTATSGNDIQGVVLNTSQGLAINDMAVTLPEGIILDLTNRENE